MAEEMFTREPKASAILVRKRRSMPAPISASHPSPSNSPPWPSCCSSTTENFATTKRSRSSFPIFPPTANPSPFETLNHTSGLPDYEDLMDALEKRKGPLWSPEKQIQDDEVLKLLKQEEHGKFAPGTSWSYSNSGYVVLGIIVSKVSGKTYGEFVQQRIFAPLKMNRSAIYQKGKNEVTNRAFGHSKESAALKETDQSSTSATLGDG